MKEQDFNNILDECLERLLGGETLEQCLERYPEQAAELKPLLETVLAIKQASAVEPRPDFKARARYQFRSALGEKAAPQRRPFFGWLPRWATVLAIVLVVLLAGGGTVAAASGSMPDSILYPVKLATENVRLALSTSELGKAGLCSDFADERVAEIIYMAEKGDAHEVEVLAERLDDRLETLAVLVSELGGEKAQSFLSTADGDSATSNGASGDSGGSGETNGSPPWYEESAPPPEDTPTEDTDVYSPEEPVVPVTVDEGGGVWGGRGRRHPQNQAELRAAMFDAAANNPAVLRAMLDEVPESVRQALLEAIEVSEEGYQEVLEALE